MRAARRAGTRSVLADAEYVDSEAAFTVLQPNRTEADAALARRAEVAVDDGI